MSTLFATVSSLLAVFVACLSYFIDQTNVGVNVVAVHHYLKLQCDRGMLGGANQTNEMKGSDLSSKEKVLILTHRGWRAKLSRSLAAFWHLPDKTIEIGNTMLTAKGAVTHIVHLMNKHAMKGYVRELFGDRLEGTVSALEIARRFYSVHRLEISEIFRSHFGLSDEFDVVFYDREETMSPRGVRQHSVYSGDDYVLELRADDVSPKDKESLLRTALRVFFVDDEDANLEDKKLKLMQFMTDDHIETKREIRTRNTRYGGEYVQKSLEEIPTNDEAILGMMLQTAGTQMTGRLEMTKKHGIVSSVSEIEIGSGAHCEQME